MAKVKYSISTRSTDGMAEVMVRFYDGKYFSQRAKSRIYVYAEAWDDKNGRMVIPKKITPQTQDIRDMQNRLDQLETAIYQVWFREKYDAGVGWLQSTIDDYLSIPKKMLRKTIPDILHDFVEKKDLEYSTKKQYASLENTLRRYEKERGRLLYGDQFTPQQVEKFVEWFKKEPVIDKEGKSSAINRGRNTISTRLKKIATACRWAVRNKIMPYTPFGPKEDGKYQIQPEVYGSKNFLYRKERDALYAFEGLVPWMATQRDIFIFQCHVGCRVMDLFSLTKDNITEDGFLQYVPSKTENENPKVIRVPLSDTAKEILARYENCGDKLLPFVNYAKYNDCVHEVARMAGLNRRVFVRDAKTGKRVAKELWEICSTHIARRTFAQNIFRLTKDRMVTSSFTGHSPTTHAFEQYAEVDDEMKEELIEQAEKY